jgi:xylulokinase
MPACLLVHDVGTSGDKASLYDARGSLLAAVATPYPTSYPAPGCCEQDPERWWDAFVKSSSAVIRQAGVTERDVEAVSFSGQMMGCVAVDRDGHALRPALIWADTRAERQAREQETALGAEKIYRICGHRPSSSYSAAKIGWLRDNEPEIYRRAASFLQAKDYMLARATGRFVTDPSDASGTNLFDLERGTWSVELVESSGLDLERLPEIVPSTAIVGGLTRAAARELGLLEGTPVVAGGGDGSCAAVGAGVVDENDAYLSLGSSSWVGVCTKSPLLDPHMRTFTWAHLIQGSFLPTGTMQTAGLSYQWISDVLLEAAGGIESETDLEGLAAHVDAGASGLLFLPYLLGERSPHWNPHARGAFVGLRMTHSSGHLVRAVMEGTAMNLRTIFDCFSEQGVSPTSLWAVGGGARSETYLAILASVFGVPVQVPIDVQAATGLGAAIAAGVGTGMFESWSIAREIRSVGASFAPEADKVALYASLHPTFLAAYDALQAVNESLLAIETSRNPEPERVI